MCAIPAWGSGTVPDRVGTAIHDAIMSLRYSIDTCAEMGRSVNTPHLFAGGLPTQPTSAHRIAHLSVDVPRRSPNTASPLVASDARCDRSLVPVQCHGVACAPRASPCATHRENSRTTVPWCRHRRGRQTMIATTRYYRAPPPGGIRQQPGRDGDHPPRQRKDVTPFREH